MARKPTQTETATKKDGPVELPTAKDLMKQIALKEAEKASEYMRHQSAAEAEKKALIDRLKKPSGVSDEEALTRRLHIASHESGRIALFTCGSPIGSLYRTFFPRYFDESFLETAAEKSDGHVWHNYWRTTDPIGARLGYGPLSAGVGAPHVRDTDVTERADEPTKGHCEYWQDGRVRRDIEAYFASCAAADGHRQGALEVGKPRRLRSLKAAFPRLHLPRN